MAPTIGVFTKTFADKTKDARYDGTFTTVYRANWSTDPSATLYNIANNLPFHPGEPVLSFLNEEDPNLTYLPAPVVNNIGGGTIPGRADYVIAPNGINRIVYPGVWKLGPYRTTGIGERSAPSLRPFAIAKFSELYLIAAEAAVKLGNNAAAREMVNVLRARAGKWKFSNALNAAKTDDHSADLTAATPQQITIEYILEERSREFFAEGYRWHDLVRTQTWNQLAGSYQINSEVKGDHATSNPPTITRTIEPKHYLRPIPQTQLDGLEMTDSEKAQYQNPGY
jgi:hypothetical protein